MSFKLMIYVYMTVARNIHHGSCRASIGLFVGTFVMGIGSR